ncbi:Wound-responsive family protein [Striga hermonthica]|uniref:Wound-responsive family protein n=1 Tax=Striga hermonthica TaxID=68872 RepID=A0A9N7N2Z3_STRHE|nr:Wound-responsive family protein [Striga hermonthica]
MSYMSRMYMAASVAAVKSLSDQGQKLKSLGRAKNRFFPGGQGPNAADLRPFSVLVKAESGGIIGAGEERRSQTEESLRQAMYFNCWGQG